MPLIKSKNIIVTVIFAALTIILSILYACGNSDGNAKVSNYSINPEHPRIYLDKQRLKEIRRRCSTAGTAQFKYYALLKEYGDKYNRIKSKPAVDDCFILAFLYSLGEIPGVDYSRRSVSEYGRAAIDILLQLSPPQDYDYFKRQTPLFIACYDWLFQAMKPQERALVYGNLISSAEKMCMSLSKPIGGRFRESREMYAFYGLAFWGDGKHIYPDDRVLAEAVDKRARGYSDFFVSWWRDQNLGILEATCKGGAYPAGTMYGEAPYPFKLWAYDAWATASDLSFYDDKTSITEFPLFFLYQMLPYPTHVRYDNANGRAGGANGIVRYGDYRYVGFTPVASRFNFTNIAQAQGVAWQKGDKDSAAALNWLIQQQGDFKESPLGGPFRTDKWIGPNPILVWDIIFREGTIEAKSPKKLSLPLAKHFGTINTGKAIKPDFPNGRPEGAGITVMRSSWDDPDGTLIWFKASSTPVVHDHRDQGSFQIYKKGWLAIDSGQYEETAHRGNYTSRTVAHNSLLVYNPDERLDSNKTDAVWKGYANDGGQRWVEPPKNLKELNDGSQFLGGITAFKSVPNLFDFVQSDITRSYNSTEITSEGHKAKVSLVTRSLIYLRPDDIIIVFDKVNTTKDTSPTRWLLHSIYRPELNGKESFSGVISSSQKIPGKSQGVRLQGDVRGGISESRDTDVIAIKGWNFGPSEGRLLVRTLLPERHITRVVGGGDRKGVRRTSLARPYEGGDTVYLRDASGIAPGDFVYIGETGNPYDKGSSGKPNWLVDDVYYQGWGNVSNVDSTTGRVTFSAYRFGLPKFPQGTGAVRSDHANAGSYEFMDAEYNQWGMSGESVANAGPYIMQHGSWRVEVEPMDPERNNLFLHVMEPCNSDSLINKKNIITNNISVVKEKEIIKLDVRGHKYRYYMELSKRDSNMNIDIFDAGKKIYSTKNKI
ncbi:hypothetical protein KI811_03775 [Geobacter hydrogenophilus]|uniref:Uncharacterized protein n=1 Tax=Geobacter hydrogenophilus TaxID=40983 RepID=A0A9W6LE76_9BACT|nr:heparinase II/III family protein [Geobacter hydrogenophilus]MBT0892940.1 hypothetical protein [Geobacter hydrogenophilus]GLI39226.1 hypothetical protein GHYDROH2_27270 [Geobacter hydrogenophilus]